MAAKLVIANKAYSSWSLRGWLVTKASGLPFEEVLIPLSLDGSSSELLKYSPTGKVPCLIDGKITIWDSLALLEYLHEQRPAAGPYLPERPGGADAPSQPLRRDPFRLPEPPQHLRHEPSADSDSANLPSGTVHTSPPNDLKAHKI